MARSEEDRYDREARLCLGDGGDFRRETLPNGRVFRRADFPAERLIDAIRRHDARILDPERPGVLKADRRAIVTAVTDLGEPVCVKEFRRPGWRQRALDRLRGSRARHAWLGAHACRVRGIRTPRPLGVLEARGRCWFVSELVTGAAPLPEWVADHRPARSAGEVRRWRALLTAVADFVAELHSHRLRHRDLAAKNLLARETDAGFELFLLDLSDVRLGRWPSRRFKIRNLGQLGQIPVPASRTDALRFFRRYAARHPELDRATVRREISTLARTRQERWLDQGGREWLAERRDVLSR